jgi:competence protein ComEA
MHAGAGSGTRPGTGARISIACGQFVRRSARALALTSSAALFVMTAAAAPVAAQTQLPDGAGKEETVRVCGTCHPSERAASVRLTREGWQETIAKMVGLGAKGTDKELEAVLDYLSTNYKGEAARPLNLNTATSIDLESIVALLRRESAAWIDYRTKAGPCKTLDDLKKVKGLDFKKIDERRDRLVCF